MIKGFIDSLTFRLSSLLILTVTATYLALAEEWVWFAVVLTFWLFFLQLMRRLYRRNAQKVAFMFDAIDNADYAFKYATSGRFSNDKLVNKSLNRITKILFQAKADAAQKEKYYELIMNSITTGIIVVDDNGYIYQTNNEALRLLGLAVFTHAKQLRKIDEGLAELITNIQPGTKQQISFTNERGMVHLSIRVSEMTLQDKHVRIIAVNDINSELDEKEIDSWIRLTRVLTHEIMNSITPVTSLSDTLLSIHGDANNEIRNGLEVISATGKGLISFVESYRKFTHIPEPHPSLFYVQKFADRMVQLATHQNHYPNIRITIDVQPEDLIVYADENLISQVVLNLLKNAMQAIGEEQAEGRIEVKAYCNEDDAVFIEVTNNGPTIPPEEAEHIFIPFFTTKESGSGIGLSISRQIMRLSGGSITLKSLPALKQTTFVLMFP
ncbi:PAS domain S-box-containing protein [Parabacteroides sp. PF5-5]|uniref:sensor histidine kinase n=1 Tax=unclassified Parabacteroides TaxID=2649774 RepID=UPI002476864B|nr:MULTISPECIES: ATP-binding protein [unclassified Parabacteroides]MDH6306491.1 PAS domain S-box-containing protein [Parabacteroides sp. PH5-39]MDH6317458.1 PAS domain S-box-containing protein [Parabacteroides sp. PF5-13]MDH6321239.1 PAS domain S-box-containing protein [Parabacteroides sp. PH5-13]MDH6324971.1 PAS domain S-box-containing protein [Parabacteroides sp. PH5-8]MDH6328680.1 PAS domain S-box-containing protein [Parabacteroides sp. PH5-41]